jgi:putative ABC transport system ATP-binding protein
MTGISVSDLHFTYPGSSFRLQVDSLSVKAGDVIGLLGPSGVGKTTLLRLMAGLTLPLRGGVSLGGTELAAMSEPARRAFRLSQVGLVFQDFPLLDYLTVEENILLPQSFAKKKVVKNEAALLGERLEISRHWKKLTGQLSQGEKQRVAIARALAHKPLYLFADEPTASLDAGRREIVMDLLFDYTRQNDACLVMVTHDQELTARFSNQAHVEDYTR